MICSHVDRGHDIFADAAAQELAIEQHVVDMADGDDLGAGIADLGETVEFAQHVRAVEQGLDDDQVGRRGVAIEGDRRLHAAHLHRDVRLGQAPVLRRLLDHRGGVLVLAKGLDVDARDRAARATPPPAAQARARRRARSRRWSSANMQRHRSLARPDPTRLRSHWRVPKEPVWRWSADPSTYLPHTTSRRSPGARRLAARMEEVVRDRRP